MKSHSFVLLFAALLCVGYPSVSFAEEKAPEAPAAEAPAAEKPEAEAEKPEPAAAEPEAPAAEEKAAEPAADAEKVEEKAEATAESVHMLVEALQSRNWALAVGMLLSILVAFANRFGLKDAVGPKAIPWVTSGVAVVGSIGAALVSGVPVLEAASQGLMAGVAAIGGWEMVLKHVLAPKKAEPAAE